MIKLAAVEKDKNAIIEEQSILGLVLIEEQNHFDGNFLIFGTVEEYEQNIGPLLIPVTPKEEKLAALAAYRYAKETAGIMVNGATIKTDRESQALIAGAKLYSDLNEAVLIDWKAENGWVQINRTAIMEISQAVAAHVQACFSQERVHAEAISALTTAAEIAAYDITTGWPATM